jgi:hypothetical protein
MAEQPADTANEKRYCCTCGRELRDWRKRWCSDECAPEKPAKPPKRKPPNERPADVPSGMTAATNTEPPSGEPDKPKSKGGPPNKKRSDELLAAIFDDMALGMTEAQACAGHGVRAETFSRWKNLQECEGLRERAQYYQIKRLIGLVEGDQMGFKRFQWMLERIYRTQYGDPARIGVQVNQQFNNGNGGDLAPNQAELDDARRRLDESKILEAKRKAGVATNVELREYFVEKIEAFQHLIDRLDAGETPDQETQQRLYQIHEESSGRGSQPIKEATGRVAGDYAPLAIEDKSRPEPAPEPKRPQPGPQDHSMRAGDMDWQSGQPKRPADGSGVSHEAPTESEYVRQCDRKLIPGPPSERQRQRLEQEKARRGGEGKVPF